MRFVVFLPYSDIDWSATGTMISAFAACMTTIMVIVIAYFQNKITKQIAEKEFEQTVRQQKIALYDKRYEIYRCFIKYYSYNTLISEGDAPDMNGVKSLDLLCEMVFDFSDNTVRTEEKERKANLLKVKEKNKSYFSQDANNKIDTAIQNITVALENEDLRVVTEAEEKISMAEFCIEDKVTATLIITYVTELLKFIMQYKHFSYNEEKYLKLRQIVKEIEEKDIVDKLKQELVLSGESINAKK